MDKQERLRKQIAFALEIDKEKDILRQTHTTSGKQENDAEHAWHMALMIYLLREHANEKFDVGKAMLMALLHDVVEIDAGDTYAYGGYENASRTRGAGGGTYFRYAPPRTVRGNARAVLRI